MNNQQILVVENNEELSTMLGKYGCQVEVAVSEQTAFNLAKLNQPELIIINTIMAEFDGYHLCEQLKADPETSELAVFFLAEEQIIPLKIKVMEMGVIDYINKPFSWDELLLRIKNQLKISQKVKQLNIKNSQLQEQVYLQENLAVNLEKQTYISKFIQQITQQIRDNINIQTICQSAAISIIESLKVSRCLILTYTEGLIPQLLPVAECKVEGIKSALLADLSIKDSYLASPIFIEDTAYICKDVYQDPNLETYQPLAVECHIKSLVMVRTSYQYKTNGLIAIHQCDYFRDWNTEEVELLELVAKQLSIAIAQAQMQEQEKTRTQAIVTKNQQLQQEISQRKKIEKQLRDSEQRWQLAIKGTNDGIFDADLQTGQVFYSTRWKEMLGYSEDEINPTREEWFNRIHPEDLPRILEADKAHLDKKSSYFEQEYRLKCADGTYKWILGRCQALWDADGTPIRLLGSHTDISQRKKIEQTLKDSEAHYRELIESQEKLLMCCWRLDTTLTFVNDSYAKFFGKSPQDLIGKTFLELIPDEDNAHQRIKLAIESMLTKKIPCVYEHYELSIHGKRWYRWNNQPIFDSQGNFREFRSYGVDISEEKLREEALSLIARGVEKEKLLSRIYRQLIDEDLDHALNSAVQIIGEYFGSDRCYLFQYQCSGLVTMTHEWCREGVCKTIHLHKHFSLEKCGLLLEDLYKNDYLYIQDTSKLTSEKAEQKAVLEQEYIKSLLVVPIKHLDLTVGFVGLDSVNQSLILANDCIELLNFLGHFLASAFERKSSEKNLKASQEKLSFLVQQAPLAIIEMNLDAEIISWNPAAEAVFGYKDFEIINQNYIEKLVPEHLKPKITQIYHDLLNARKENPLVNENLTKEGKIIICEWYNTPVIDNEGSVIGIACIAVNVTQRKQTEVALKQAKEAAETASRAKSNFLACMSHELRTPLISILGFSQVLTQDATIGEKQRENILTIHRSGKHLSELINNILSMSKIEAGKLDLEEKPFYLNDLLHYLQEMYQLKIQEKGLNLALEYDPNLPECIKGDEIKIRQVLINLLQNALKFTPKGHIILRVKVPSESEKLLFEVEDTGIGIAPEEISTIFEPFAQTFRGSQYSDGTGLGLAISREYIHLMGGEIHVKSNLGIGSVFSVYIPLKIDQCVQNIPLSKPTVLQPNHRVLIVDDQDDNRQMLKQLLKNLPLEIKEAINGQQAILLCQTWTFDLIFMDMEMPVMDGYQTTQFIKKNKLNQHPLVIGISDGTLEEEQRAIFIAGCDDVISKPFEQQKILKMMFEYLGVSGYEPTQCLIKYNTVVFKQLTKEDLKAMPSSWLNRLHLAALEINDQEIIELIKLIPPQETDLINGLTHLVKNFRVDLILELTK